MTRLLLNAHELTCDGGSHRLWRIELAGEDRPRRSELEDRFGVPLWLGRDAAWATDPVEGDNVSETQLSCHANPSVHAFVLREALLRRGRAAGYDVWMGFGHEINCADPRYPMLDEGPVRVEPVLRMRVAHEGLTDELVVLVLRRSVRWRFAEPLTATWLRPVADGEAAVRIAGDGPARARVGGFEGDQVVLDLRRGEQRRLRPTTRSSQTRTWSTARCMIAPRTRRRCCGACTKPRARSTRTGGGTFAPCATAPKRR